MPVWVGAFSLWEMSVSEELKAETDWLQAGSLLYRLTDEHRPRNCDEINVTMAHGSRDMEDRTKRASVLLAAITAEPPPTVPEGFALVPIEPPIDMVVAAERWLVNLQHMRASDKREAVTQALRAAIAAAPTESK